MLYEVITQMTVTLEEAVVGTSLTIKQEGIPDLIPEALCVYGWRESLLLLAQLVEAEIPD